MATATQEFIALALVILVAGFALWRRLSKPKDASCSNCKSNPANSAENETADGKKETVLRFMPKPGSKS
jgi:hypothetical protein